MGTATESNRDESLRSKGGIEGRKASGSYSNLMPIKVLHKVSNSRTQLFLLFAVIYCMTMRWELFKHPTNSLVTDIRM